MLRSRRSRVVVLGLWSTAVTTTSPATANVTGTRCGRRSTPHVASTPRGAAEKRLRHSCSSICTAPASQPGTGQRYAALREPFKRAREGDVDHPPAGDLGSFRITATHYVLG